MPSSARPKAGVRPLLILDVDGVISPIAGAHMGPLPDTWSEWRRAPSIRMPVYFAPHMVLHLTSLPVERIWCSTWEKEVDEFGLSNDLGWAGQPFLRLPAPSRPWNKLVAVREHLSSQPDRPFVWVDDDPRMVSSGMRWARTIQTPHLLVHPEKKVGLTPHHVGRIERWVETIAG
ncbi:MAG TPA: HAD domain-containing protein [Candidatus Saccharimonadales bacterium]|nr:HAD domain-containing protein [Candidatus Saccharimonadales bacterium]